MSGPLDGEHEAQRREPASPEVPRGEQDGGARRTSSSVRPTRSPGWIWAVPLAAAGIVIWLLVRSLSDRGVNATVIFDDSYGMTAGSTKVTYRGMEVGEVKDLTLSTDGRQVSAQLDLDKRVADYLRAGTQFYLQGAHPSLSNLSSLKSLVAGPSIVLVPGHGPARRDFIGVAYSPPETLAVAVPYQVSFAGDVGAVQPGAPVTLRGFTVGAIHSVRLAVDARTGAIATPIVIDLDPTRFHLEQSPAARDWKTRMNDTLSELVQHGLRAHLEQSPPFVGAQQVVLEMVPNAPPAALRTSGTLAEIPTVEGGPLSDLPKKLAQLPIQQIADNVRAITQQVKTLTSDPKLGESIAHLDRTLSVLEQTVHQAGPQVAPTLASVHQTVDSLRETATEIDSTAQAAQKVVGGSAAAPSGNLQQSLRELTDAARSVRTFADYLDQHPEALIHGR